MKHYSMRARSAYIRAFTLIELSIGLVIMSLLAAGALTVGGVVVEQQQFTGSNQRVAEAKKAIENYFSVNGRLPCPASLTTASGAAGFGVEVNCAAGGGAPAGTARVNSGGAFSGGANTAGVVRIGALPVRTLGLRDSAMSDEYGNRILYSMTEQFGTVATVAAATGAITLRDGNGNDIATSATANGAVFAVYSAGPDGKGANRYQSGAATVVGCAGGLDAENCNGDIILRDTRFNNGAGAASYYDDMLQWSPKYLLTNSSTSTAASGSTGWVQYNNGGFLGSNANFFWDIGNNRLGIGTATPSMPLHVRSSYGPALFETSNTGYTDINVYNSSVGAINTGGSTWSFLVAGSAGINGQPPGSMALHQHGAAPRLVIDNTGNVGIGTANPTRALQVQRNTTDYVAYLYNTDTTNGYGVYARGGAYGLVAYADNASGNAVVGQNVGTGATGYLGSGTAGIYGSTPNSASNAVYGVNSGSGSSGYLGSGGTGVYGIGTTGHGVYGLSVSNMGVYGQTSNGSNNAIMGYNASSGAAGYLGSTNNGVVGSGPNYGGYFTGGFIGLFGYNTTIGTHGYIGYGSWSFSGTGDIYTSGVVVSSSDKRLKEDIKDIKSPLQQVMKLHPVTYNWKKNSEQALTQKGIQYGLIAQEVRDVIPNIVREAEATPQLKDSKTGKLLPKTLNQELGTFLTIDYSRFVPFLIGAAKELKAENDALGARVEALEKALGEKGVVVPEAKPANDTMNYRTLSLLLGGALAGFVLTSLVRRRG